MTELSTLDVAGKFVGQVRRAFEGCGPKPVFSVKRKKNGVWVVDKIQRLDSEITPKVYYPIPNLSHFMEMTFQGRLNDLLKKVPIVLTGTAHLRFKTKDGQYAKISDVRWTVEVYKIRKLEMTNKGVIAITQFDFRSK